MGVQQAAITGYQSNITNAINANAEIVKKNTPLNNQLKELNAQENTINKEIQSVNTEIAIIDGNITEVKTQIAAIEASINSSKIIEYTHKVTVAQNSTIADFEYNTGLTDTENVKTDTQYNPANPFLAFSYDTTQYLNMTDALEAMAANNEQNIQTAQNQVESNREEIRKMFQDLLK